MTEKNNNLAELKEVGIGALLTIGAFYAYFAGYEIAIKNFSLGRYSFLVVGIILALFTAFELFSFLKNNKKK